jgi:2-haloacid dehalogenase
MIRAILWDIDGTLLDFSVSEKAAIRKCFEIFGLGTCTDEMVSVYSKINSRYWRLLEDGKMSKQDILISRFREFFPMYGIDPSVSEAFNDEYQLRLSDTVVFTDGAEEVINCLHGSVIQCAASNGTRVAQEGKLRRSGIDRIFEHTFISENIGYEKPDPGFFNYVMSALAPVRPEEVLIVGDSLSSDMKGGFNAGIRTCWYDPQKMPNTTDMTFDHIIADLREVPPIIRMYA